MHGRALIRMIDFGVAIGALLLLALLAAFSWLSLDADGRMRATEAQLIRKEIEVEIERFDRAAALAFLDPSGFIEVAPRFRGLLPQGPESRLLAVPGSAIEELVAQPSTMTRLRHVMALAEQPEAARPDFLAFTGGSMPTLLLVKPASGVLEGGGLVLEIVDMAALAARLSTVGIELHPIETARVEAGLEDFFDVTDAAGASIGRLQWSGKRVGHTYERLVLPGLMLILFLGAWVMLVLRRHWDATRNAFIGEMAQVRELASTDMLTNLPNRRALFDYLGKRDEAGAEVPAQTLLILDLDGFTWVNDMYGHHVGDQVIRSAGQAIREVLGEEGFVARMGGDEFVAVISGTLDLEALETLRQQLETRISELAGESTPQGSLGVMLGAVASSEHPVPGPELLRLGDIALNSARQSDRRQAVMFEARMEREVTHRRTLERELRAAIANGEVFLNHQPIVDSLSEAIVGFESLVRWHHPTRGIVMPGEFIPIAETSDLIVELGNFVLELALCELQQFGDLSISVNATGRQLLSPGFADFVRTALAKHKVAPERLCLELTETSLITDGERVAEVMADLRASGVRFAIDDFGAGYSSLGYLLKFKFDSLKIDRDFIIALDDKPESSMIVTSIVSLARSLGMRVVGEGVESAPQHRFLAGAGCSHVQGYLFGRPVPVSTHLARLLPGLGNGPDQAIQVA